MPSDPEATGGAAPLQVEAVLDVVLASAGRLLLGEGGSIMLLIASEELEVVCAPDNPAALGARVRFGEGVAGKVAASQDPVLVTGRAGRRSKPVDSAMSVPLLHEGRIFGVLNINAAGGHTFSEHDLKAATAFGGHAARALAAARMYEMARRDGAPNPERHLDEMLGHLAEGSRIDFVEPRPAVPVDAAGVAREVAVAHPGTELRGADSLPVLAEPRHLRRALDELVENGHRHGGAPVRIILEDRDGLASLTVVDGGPGVPAEDRRRIFEPYARLEGAASLPGLGLGLTIARRLVESMGGELVVDETPIGGAAFRMSLRRS